MLDPKQAKRPLSSPPLDADARLRVRAVHIPDDDDDDTRHTTHGTRVKYRGTWSAPPSSPSQVPADVRHRVCDRFIANDLSCSRAAVPPPSHEWFIVLTLMPRQLQTTRRLGRGRRLVFVGRSLDRRPPRLLASATCDHYTAVWPKSVHAMRLRIRLRIRPPYAFLTALAHRPRFSGSPRIRRGQETASLRCARVRTTGCSLCSVVRSSSTRAPTACLGHRYAQRPHPTPPRVGPSPPRETRSTVVVSSRL